MAYRPKTKAALELKEIADGLERAQLDWGTYALKLGIGYNTAFDVHEGALKSVEEKYRLAAQSQYWVLSLLCVAMTGGVIGGLLAPWVGAAGASLAAQFVRTFTSETLQSAGQGVVGAKLTHEAKGNPFKPVLESPSKYKDKLQVELGTCYFELYKELERLMREIDDLSTQNKPTLKHLQIAARWREIEHSPLANSPAKLPDSDEVARAAEIGMWLAWVSVRDFDYWKTRYEKVNEMRDRGVSNTPNPYLSELLRLSPVVTRLDALGIANHSTTTYDIPYFTRASSYQRAAYAPVRVVDLHKMRTSGPIIAAQVPKSRVFLGKVTEVVKEPHRVLPELKHSQPAKV
jgi:hypothetical protein